VVDLIWDIWLAAMLSEGISCTGPICIAATLHHHALLLLVCGSACVIGLVGLGIASRGFSLCGGREVVGIAVATAAGCVALLGIVVLITGLAIALIVLAAFVLGFVGFP
jgi:hypothetical protein